MRILTLREDELLKVVEEGKGYSVSLLRSRTVCSRIVRVRVCDK